MIRNKAPVELGKHSKRFGQPVAMTKEQIGATVERFATTASLAERAGFDGVEVHAAHGYLLSQFLSPLVNQRTDEWGGGLENRARLLLDAVRAIREAASSSFAVAVKLNSADFQRGGFDAEDAAGVIAMLEPHGSIWSSSPEAAMRALRWPAARPTVARRRARRISSSWPPGLPRPARCR